MKKLINNINVNIAIIYINIKLVNTNMKKHFIWKNQVYSDEIIDTIKSSL
jgi:hypothetical protein